jgi:deoxyribose-phosphate aldolase
MNIEYNLYNIDYNEIELKAKIEEAIKYSVSSISVPFAYTKLCKSLVKDTGIKIANPIDYPLGIMDTNSRGFAIKNAIDNGAQKINIVIQNNLLCSKKYDKIKQDIQNNNNICTEKNVDLNYYVEYRTFTHQSLIKACAILLENNIQKAYVSTGFMLDNPEDNLIATVLLKDKSKIQTIFTGNIWTVKHVENLRKNNISYVCTNSIESIKLIHKYL